MKLAFPRFAPDRSDHAPDATGAVMNVKPVADGYAPLKTLITFSAALAAAPRGQIAVRTASGLQATFAGTETGLYKLASNGTWTDVTGVSGPYGVADGEDWSFGLFGSRIIATNGVDPVQYFDLDSSTDFADLPGSPPLAKYVVIAGDFVWLMNLSTDRAGYAFSGLNDSEQWTIGENFSDVGTFPDGGEIMGGVPASGGVFIIQRNAIRLATFNPASGFTYTIQPVDMKTGAISPFSIADIGNGTFFFLAQDGFYLFNNGLQPIGAERVDRTFRGLVSDDQMKLVRAAVDNDEKLVFVRFQKPDGSSAFYLYDWQLNEWSQSDQNVSAVGQLVTASLTLEDLDTIFPGGIDSVLLSVDSSEFSGGVPALAGFSSDWRLGFFTGEQLAATLETSTTQLNAPTRAFVRGAQIVGDVAISGPGSFDDTDLIVDDLDISGDDYYDASFSLQAGTADYHAPSATLTWGAESTPNFYTGIVPFRSSGRLHRFRLNIGVGTSWRHVTGLDVDAIGEGNR